MIHAKPHTRYQHIHVLNAPSNQASIFIDGVLVGLAPYKGNIPLCAQQVIAVWQGNIASAVLMGEQTPQELKLLLTQPKKEDVSDLLGFVPPRCRRPEGVDQECVEAWLRHKKQEFEARDSHMHHEGCSH